LSLFGPLGEIVSGRRLHKNTTNNVVVSELYKGCEMLPLEHQEMFRNFVVAASTVADMFFFDDNHPREINAKSYTIGQFRLFYEAVVTLFVHLYGFANPHLVPSLTSSLGTLATDRTRVAMLLARLRKHAEVNSATVGETYTHLIEEAGIGTTSFEPFTVFTSGCLVAYNSAFARDAD
jgi:hypothetical protein